jgi:hypothetical protein
MPEMRRGAMRVYLASLFTGHAERMEKLAIENKPIYILDSFYYKTDCEKSLKYVDMDHFILDSGAFTFMGGAKATKEQMDGYIGKYIDFINSHNVKYYIEVDVESIFGMKQVEIWRKRLESKTGKKSIPVWHINRGIEYWKKMVEGYKYIAIGGQVQRVFNLGKADFDNFKKMIAYAKSKGVKVHGLGFTKTGELEEYDYFSVDSSTWKTAALLGKQVHIFDGKKIIQKKLNTEKRVRFRKMIEHNFVEWCKYQKYMDKGIV